MKYELGTESWPVDAWDGSAVHFSPRDPVSQIATVASDRFMTALAVGVFTRFVRSNMPIIDTEHKTLMHYSATLGVTDQEAADELNDIVEAVKLLAARGYLSIVDEPGMSR